MNREDFFDLVWGQLEGEVRISLKGLRDGRWFTWPSQRQSLLDYVEEHKSTDVYFSVTLYSRRTRRSMYATQGNVVYADADLCPPEAFRLKPSISVQTSPGHWQVYWLLDTEADANALSEASHRVSVGHKEDLCDPSGWVLTKMLRVPGTSHTKTEFTHPVIGECSGEMYSLDQIHTTYSDVDLAAIQESAEDLPEDLPNSYDLTGDTRMTPALWTFWSTAPDEGVDLSSRMWRLEMDLFRAGFSAPEVFVLVRDSRSNKYSPDRFGEITASGGERPYRSDPDGDLWAEIQRASVRWQDVVERDVVLTEEEVFIEANQRFLTNEEEYEVSQHTTFIDRYVAWGKSRTDASVEYHRALAFLLLANIYGDRATLHLSFGLMRLNLWIMLLGDTTKTRKSTARRLMLEVLHEFEERSGEKVDVGSDFTPEALTRALGERADMTSLVHRDEAQGWFNEILNKAHHAGVLERLTDMYDGKVPVVLRNSDDKAQKNRANIVFNMLLMGIADQTARVLTPENFRSGFLTRFLWVAAPNLEMTEDRLKIKQGDPNKRKGGVDPVVAGFVKEFRKNLNSMPRSEIPIYLTDDALDRVNRWVIWMIREVVPKTRQPENLEPTVQRMAHSILKCSALLALHDGHNKVELRYVLISLKYAEEWFDTLRLMSDDIADSTYSNAVNDVETFVYHGGGKRLMSAVYSKFRAFSIREVDDWVNSLVLQGRAQLNGQSLVLREQEK